MNVSASGRWLVQSLSSPGELEQLLFYLSPWKDYPNTASWDLSGITYLDHLGAQIFWMIWGGKKPARLILDPRHEPFFDRLVHVNEVVLDQSRREPLAWVITLGQRVLRFFDHVLDFVGLLGEFAFDVARVIRRPSLFPWREFSANLFRIGAQALGITALVGFLIGIVLSYLSAQQLRTLGADIYIVNILGLGIVRELGPLLAAILIAGRSGSAITAQIGVMRVTEELDAMLVMGIPHGLRLVFPKVVALIVAMPLLVVWTDALAILGGMTAAHVSLDLSTQYFLRTLPRVVPRANVWIGVGKSAAFGLLIGLTSCHFGLRIRPNTTSLGAGTNASVVTAITIVILADAIFAIVFKNIGL